MLPGEGYVRVHGDRGTGYTTMKYHWRRGSCSIPSSYEISVPVPLCCPQKMMSQPAGIPANRNQCRRSHTSSCMSMLGDSRSIPSMVSRRLDVLNLCAVPEQSIRQPSRLSLVMLHRTPTCMNLTRSGRNL